jgi:hypothetical protein
LEIRDLNELIRQRYALDVQIWGLKACQRRDRPRVVDMMRRSDAALLKIMAIVHAWGTAELWESSADWHRLRDIKERLETGNQRVWAQNPPWTD